MQQVCAALGVPLEMLEVPPTATSVLQRMCVNLLKVTAATTPTQTSCRPGMICGRWPTSVVLGCSGWECSNDISLATL